MQRSILGSLASNLLVTRVKSSRSHPRASLNRVSVRSMSKVVVDEKFARDQKALGDIMQREGAQGPLDRSNAWETLWQQNITPWDARKHGSAPALVKLVQSGLLPSGEALVPGCGSGSDLVTLAAPDRHVVGLELSSTAAKVAQQTLEEKKVDPSQAEVVVGDFFALDHAGRYNLIFDYTFMAALPVEWREKWAAKMWELVAPGGILITLMFPVGDFKGGPPFASRPKQYEDLLTPLGFVLEMSEPVKESFPAREGREHIAIWRKPAGKL